MISLDAQPLLRRPVVAAIDSGTFDMKTAMTTARSMVAPPSRVRPMTIDSGMLSRMIPSTIARGELSSGAFHALAPGPAHPIDEQVADVERHGAGSKTHSDPEPPSLEDLERFLDEVVRDSAEQNARAEGHGQTERLARDLETQADRATKEQRGRGAKAPRERPDHQLEVYPGHWSAAPNVPALLADGCVPHCLAIDRRRCSASAVGTPTRPGRASSRVTGGEGSFLAVLSVPRVAARYRHTGLPHCVRAPLKRQR